MTSIVSPNSVLGKSIFSPIVDKGLITSDDCFLPAMDSLLDDNS